MIHQFQIKMDGYNIVFFIAFEGDTCDWNFLLGNFPTEIFPTEIFPTYHFFQVNLPTCAPLDAIFAFSSPLNTMEELNNVHELLEK